MMEKARKNPVIAVLLGDATGVGPELITKLMADGTLTENADPVLLGDPRILEEAVRRFHPEVRFQVTEEPEKADRTQGIPLYPCGPQDPALIGQARAEEEAGRACLEMLDTTVRLFREERVDGFVCGPLNKAAMKMADHTIISELEYLAEKLSVTGGHCEFNMLDGLWTSRVTSHIPVKEISAELSTEKILDSIRLLHSTLQMAGYAEPAIGICALNPHAGENGTCGREEIDVIAPAVRLAVEEGIHAEGPFPADTLFIRAFKGAFQGVVTMFHDQGQIAMKLRGFERGMTIFGGLPLPGGTSAHGTAHDIAWQGIADPGSLRNAYKTVVKMASNGR